MKIYALLMAPEQVAGRRYITEHLRQRFTDDETYRRDLLTMSGDFDAHPEVPVMRLMEMVGVYVKHGLLDENIIFDFWVPLISKARDELTSLGVIEAQRTIEPAMFVNFEHLVTRYHARESPAAGGAASDAIARAQETA